MILEEYFFYEWLIIQKDMTVERFNNISQQEFDEFKAEYAKFMSK